MRSSFWVFYIIGYNEAKKQIKKGFKNILKKPLLVCCFLLFLYFCFSFMPLYLQAGHLFKACALAVFFLYSFFHMFNGLSLGGSRVGNNKNFIKKFLIGKHASVFINYGKTSGY